MRLALLLALSISAFAQTRQVDALITPSPSSGVTGYNIYRFSKTLNGACSAVGGVKVNAAPIPVTPPIAFSQQVPFGTYCYWATALAGSDESTASPVLQLTVAPKPLPPGDIQFTLPPLAMTIQKNADGTFSLASIQVIEPSPKSASAIIESDSGAKWPGFFFGMPMVSTQ